MHHASTPQALAAAGASPALTVDHSQQHPIKLYLVVWSWLFILSTFSYMVDYFHVQSYLRWTLILLFMMLKAGLIVAFFMHMKWERLAFVYAVMVPLVFVVVFTFLMIPESDHTLLTRTIYFGGPT